MGTESGLTLYRVVFPGIVVCKNATVIGGRVFYKASEAEVHEFGETVNVNHNEARDRSEYLSSWSEAKKQLLEKVESMKGEVKGRSEKKPTLKQMLARLKKKEWVEVTFIKRSDGSERTLKVSLTIPAGVLVGKDANYKAEDKGLIRVFDLGEERVKSIPVDGIRFLRWENGEYVAAPEKD